MHTIGELARRTGLTVKAVRFYADTGLVPATGRNAAGHRVYDAVAAARLDLVRTLRDLGLDLPSIRRVLNRETSMADTITAHADALEVHIRTLKVRQAVLRTAAKRGAGPEEVDLMNKLATLTEDQRRRLIVEFLDSAFDGVNGEFDGIARTLTPELPDDPTPDQVEAWVELAEISRDEEFRGIMRRLLEQHASGRADVVRPDLAAVVHRHVALDVDPRSPEAARVVAAIEEATGLDADRLATWLADVGDPRRERYLRLLAVINGWQRPDSLAPTFDWLARALAG
ncbi:MerR family transcriptional regulator [Umezawaea sp. NPDC059074]|uniref:MerR family transcriptional regulator n=1 Tax=Umezawaea sp. NPDC059074 TaxID=3346716 RepID=UPI0036A53632